MRSCHVQNADLFFGCAKSFAEQAVRYYNAYGVMPTRRVMLEEIGKNPDQCDEANFIWDKLDGITHDSSEFRFDLDKLGNNFTSTTSRRAPMS